MRKIEEKMWNAIHSGRNMKRGNTAVVHESEGWSFVLLHGHVIAAVDRENRQIIADPTTFINWPTATTRSRLRALGFNARIYKRWGVIDGPIVLNY